MSGIKIDIQKTGFPVTLGEVELWFDSSMENIKKFIHVEEIAEKKLKEAKEKSKHIHFPKLEDIDEEAIRGIDPKDLEEAFNVTNELVAAQYDILFGDGTFKKIYKKYPDIFALEKALEPLGQAIAKKIEEIEFERIEEVENIKKEYVKKKASKLNASK